MEDKLELFVDPEISKQKFDRELLEYRNNEDEYIKRGWLLIKAAYPEVFIIFTTPQLKPHCVVFGVVINFDNYDFWAPSVRFVDPFTQAPIKRSELIVSLQYRVKSSKEVASQEQVQWSDLIQAHTDDKPFLCLPGIREYHEHPAHSNDSWFLHRGKGEGNLFFILDTIYKHGIYPINSYNFQTTIQMTFQGLIYDRQKIP